MTLLRQPDATAGAILGCAVGDASWAADAKSGAGCCRLARFHWFTDMKKVQSSYPLRIHDTVVSWRTPVGWVARETAWIWSSRGLIHAEVF